MSDNSGRGAIDLGLDGFQVNSIIGRGGFSTVYKAWDANHDRWVAIKVIRPEGDIEAIRRSFNRERKIAGRLSQHPNVVTIHHSGDLPTGEPYLVMDYFPQGSLSDRVADHGPLRWTEAVDLLAPIANALDEAHRVGVIHNDIKPANILLRGDVGYLGDFGIAAVANATATRRSAATYYYAPPEFFLTGIRDARSDIYSLAATMYYLVEGLPPYFQGRSPTDGQIMNRILDPNPPSFTNTTNPQLQSAVITGLAKSADQRPQNAAALIKLLRQGAPNQSPPTLEPPSSPVSPTPGVGPTPSVSQPPPVSQPWPGTRIPAADPTPSVSQPWPGTRIPAADPTPSVSQPWPANQSPSGTQAPAADQSRPVGQAPVGVPVSHTGPGQVVSAPAPVGSPVAASPSPNNYYRPLPSSTSRGSSAGLVLGGFVGLIILVVGAVLGSAFLIRALGGGTGTDEAQPTSAEGSLADSENPDNGASSAGNSTGTGQSSNGGDEPQAFAGDGDSTQSGEEETSDCGVVIGDGVTISGNVKICAEDETATTLAPTGGSSNSDDPLGPDAEEVPPPPDNIYDSKWISYRWSDWASSGNQLVVGTGPYVVIYDGSSGERVGEPFVGHSDTVVQVAWSPDGTKIASAAEDDTVRIWDVASRKQIGEAVDLKNVTFQKITWSPDSSRVLTTLFQGALIWDAKTGAQIGGPLFEDRLFSKGLLSWAPTADLIVGLVSNDIQILDPDTRTSTATIDSISSAGETSFALSPVDARVAAVSTSNGLGIWDLKTGDVLGYLEGHEDYLFAYAFSPDGKFLASASPDETLRLWDTTTFKQIGEPINIGEDSIEALAWSSDGSVLAVGSYGEVRTLDVKARTRYAEPYEFNGILEWLDWSPGGSELVIHTFGNTEIISFGP